MELTKFGEYEEKVLKSQGIVLVLLIRLFGSQNCKLAAEEIEKVPFVHYTVNVRGTDLTLRRFIHDIFSGDILQLPAVLVYRDGILGRNYRGTLMADQYIEVLGL